MAEGGIQRSAQGVPIFDGSPEGLPAFREEALQYLMTFEHHKRYLAAPRLVKELQGVAKTSVRRMTTKNPEWVAHPRGVYQLLQHLEELVARPSLVDASRYVMKFFYGMSRRRGESMTSWISRHSEAMWEASQALRRAEREYGQRQDGPSTRHTSEVGSMSGSVGRRSGPFRDDGRLAEDEEEDEQEDGRGWQEWGWYGRDQGWHGRWSDGGWKSWGTSYEPPAEWDTSTESFLPDFLVGFLLLHRSSLDPNERTNILASIRGKFDPEAVARALREQWTDADLAKRDKAKMHSVYMVDEEEDEFMEALAVEDWSEGLESMDGETQEAYAAAEERAQEALEALKQAKTTLKEARWSQKQMKLGRRFFPSKPFPKGSGKGSDKGGIKCFRCGGNHKIADCPQKPSANDGIPGGTDRLCGQPCRSRERVQSPGCPGARDGRPRVRGGDDGPGRHSELHGSD